MGPGPPKKNNKGGSKNASQRALNTAGPGSSYAGSGVTSTDASSPTAAEGSRISGEGWNYKRYQREDEALWGHDTQGPGQRIMDAIAKAGSTAGRLLEARLSKSGHTEEEENPKSYYLAKNPPVNDLHPPVVSTQPASRDETRWMLQPPPTARVMEGKERVNRERADSNTSSRKGGDTTPLSRQVTGRLVEARLQRGETPSAQNSRANSSRQRNNTLNKGHRHERNKSSGDTSESSDTIVKRKRKPPPISISTSTTSSLDTIQHIPIPSLPLDKKEGLTRPPLPTLLSSSIAIPKATTETKSTDDLPLRELSAPSSSELNTRATSSPSRLSPNANSMPASIPRVETKGTGTDAFVFPRPKSVDAGANGSEN